MQIVERKHVLVLPTTFDFAVFVYNVVFSYHFPFQVDGKESMKFKLYQVNFLVNGAFYRQFHVKRKYVSWFCQQHFTQQFLCIMSSFQFIRRYTSWKRIDDIQVLLGQFSSKLRILQEILFQEKNVSWFCREHLILVFNVVFSSYSTFQVGEKESLEELSSRVRPVFSGLVLALLLAAAQQQAARIHVLRVKEDGKHQGCTG